METSLVMNAEARAAWDLLTDTTRWPQWGPSVAAVESPVRFIEAGTVGRVRTTAGFWLPFTVTDFEPGRFWSWKVAGVTATGHSVEPLGPERCRVSFDVPFFAAPYLVVCRVALGRIRGVLEGSGLA